MAATSPPKRKTGKAEPVIPAATDEFAPLQFTTPDEPVVEERVTIAYIDDYELTMPKTVPPNVALKVMRTSRTQGDEMAMMQMLEEVIGPDGYERLANWPALTGDHLIDLFKVVQKVSMGALEVPKSSSGNG